MNTRRNAPSPHARGIFGHLLSSPAMSTSAVPVPPLTSPPPLPAIAPATATPALSAQQFAGQLADFKEFGKETRVEILEAASRPVPVFINEFWTSKQRAAHPLHEISYRACFKPQLPRFFIERLTKPGDTVYDPFMGRGTTLLEAALLDRVPAGCDINPLSRVLIPPRLNPPPLELVRDRLAGLQLDEPIELEEPLLVFYHPSTLRRILNLRRYLCERSATGTLDGVDAWIRMVATNRLTGHSPGFFSVYTMPPNQALSLESQRKINQRRNQTPPERDVAAIILRKSRSLLGRCEEAETGRLRRIGEQAVILTGDCSHTPAIGDASVDLIVTSPPFLDVVDYKRDNWLRCWFNGIDAATVPVLQLRNVEAWQTAMGHIFRELRRLLRPGGKLAFEVGEVRRGSLLMEKLVVPAAESAELVPLLVLVNDQNFTKTANCWGVSNQTKGTNSNRIVVLERPADGECSNPERSLPR